MTATNSDRMTKFQSLVEQRLSPQIGLLSFFMSSAEDIFEGDRVEFDKVKNKRLIAIGQNRPAATTENGSDTYQNVAYTPPVYKEARPYTVDNYSKRIAGNTVYTQMEKTAMIKAKTASDVALLTDKITRAKLVQASYLLQTGSIPFATSSLAKNTADIDFEAPSAHFSTVSVKWDNASADPIGDIETQSQLIKKESGSEVEDIIYGSSAWQYFISNTDVQSQLDNRRIQRGELVLNPREKTGLAFNGSFNFDGTIVRLWTYSDWYVSPAGVVTSYIDPKKVVFIADGDLRIMYAGIDQIQDISDTALQGIIGSSNIRNIGMRSASSRYIDTYKDNKNSSVWLRVQEAALCVPRTNDTFGCLTVLT